MALEYAKIVGRLGTVRGDDSAPAGVVEETDLDDYPDTVWCTEGTVIFEPVVSQMKVLAPVEDPTFQPYTAGNRSIVCTVDAEGYLTHNGKRYVYLLDLGAGNVNPQVSRDTASYRVTFVGVKCEGIPVNFTAFGFHPRSDVEENDLTILAPVEVVGGQAIVQGPRGFTGPANELSIGTVSTVTSGVGSSASITGDPPTQVLDLTLEAGPPNVLSVGSVATGLPGSAASVDITGESPAQVLDFTIPRGDKGEKGDKGDPNTLSIGTVADGPNPDATITGDAPNQTLNLVLQRGPANVLSIGNVITGEPGSLAEAAITGTTPAQVLSLSIPRGEKGEPNVLSVGTVTSVPWGQGTEATITGTTPAQTLNLTLESGPPNTLNIGTVSTGAAGSPASADITGQAPNQTLSLSIPKGDTGENAEWLSGDGTPALALGIVGDHYLDRLTGDVYEKTAPDTWTPVANIRGPKGDPGSGNVNTVNGYYGPDVVLSYTDVGAEPAGAVATLEATRGQPGGLATLNTEGHLTSAQLPPLAINETFTPADEAAMLALPAQRGDMAVRLDNGRTYVALSDAPDTLAEWQEVMAAGQVQSVNGYTGVITLTKADVGLGNVDNTSDLDKPISTATQTALDGKVDDTDPRLTGANVSRVVHDGTSYPPRPEGATYVEWVGPTQPTVGTLPDDTWVKVL